MRANGDRHGDSGGQDRILDTGLQASVDAGIRQRKQQVPRGHHPQLGKVLRGLRPDPFQRFELGKEGEKRLGPAGHAPSISASQPSSSNV